MLIMVIFLLFLLALSLTVAVPHVAKSIQLDRERETKERGKQYIRAIQLYYRQFHAYPPNLQALVKTNNIRFLRKRYIDPMTGKDDWQPIHYGQNKVPTAMGFFGQPLEGNATTIAGVGPSGGNVLGGSTPGSGIGTTSTSGSSLNLFGSSSSGTTSSGTSGATGSTGSTGDSSSDSSSGTTFGGAGIIGFKPGSTGESISTYKGKNHFNEWEFVYDPLMDQKAITNNTGGIGNPASSSTTPIGSSTFGTTPTSSSSSDSSSTGQSSTSSQ